MEITTLNFKSIDYIYNNEKCTMDIIAFKKFIKNITEDNIIDIYTRDIFLYENNKCFTLQEIRDSIHIRNLNLNTTLLLLDYFKIEVTYIEY